MNRFISVQIGARHNYAVPSILEKAGMLESFYTDLVGNAGFGKILSRGGALPIVGDRLKLLAGRQVPAKILPLTHTFSLPDLRWLVRKTLASPDRSEEFQLSCLKSLELGNAMVRAGFGNATHIYSMLGECPPLLIAANQRGLKIVSEVYILLSSDRILAKERIDFPDWEPASPDYETIGKKLFPEDVLLTRTNFFICPSQAVQSDLVQNFGISVEKTAVVPYGMQLNWLDIKQNTIPQRILFVGSANLRKGIHYLAMAAEQLYLSGYRYEFRVAGDVEPSVLEKPVCKYLTFLGRIPRNEVHQEFSTADIFVLPSLAEGSASVTYEALAAGLPVVTTNASGSVVQDGIEGYIVPERDPDTLAKAIINIIEDRNLREKMSIAARDRAKDFSSDRYGERLLAALKAIN
jgi:glycosyltransferase involved in cell wall biosynthesis